MAGPAVSAGPRQVSQYRSHYIEAEHPRTTPCWPREGFAQTSRARARTSAGGVRIRWTARERIVYEYASDDETSSSLSWPTAAAPPGARTTCSAAAAAADGDCNIISKRTVNRNLAEQPRSRKGQRGGGASSHLLCHLHHRRRHRRKLGIRCIGRVQRNQITYER